MTTITQTTATPRKDGGSNMPKRPVYLDYQATTLPIRAWSRR